jgi:hypothetical protein
VQNEMQGKHTQEGDCDPEVDVAPTVSVKGLSAPL